MTRAEVFCHTVDKINERVGSKACLLLIPIVLITAIEVTMRYVFDSPTIWAWDINIQLMAVLASLVAGYTLLHKDHVIVDIVVVRLSPRARAVLDLVTCTVFLVGIGALLWWALGEASLSVQRLEVYNSMMRPPIYPLKIIVVIGIVLLLIQYIAKIIRDVNLVTHSGTGGKK